MSTIDIVHFGDTEIWKPIPNYERRYEVSSSGNVRSLAWEGTPGKVHPITKIITKGPRNKVGYFVVRFHRDSVTKTFFVGRLVLETFVRPAQPGEEMNHINGDTLNDCLVNLEWQTRSGNQKHAIANGLAKKPISPQPLHSGKCYWWHHREGEIVHATPSDMARSVHASSAPFYKMISGKNQPYRSFHGWKLLDQPPPGSNEALEQACACAIIDNNYGRGNAGLFWINEDCPLHGKVKMEPTINE